MSPSVVLLLIATLASTPTAADALYKSVDSAGNVTYSSTPPKAGKVQKLDVAPPPSEAEVRATEERLKKNAAQAQELEAQRQEREAAEAAREAEAARQREEEQANLPAEAESPAALPQPLIYPPPISGYPGNPAGRPYPLPRLPLPR